MRKVRDSQIGFINILLYGAVLQQRNVVLVSTFISKLLLSYHHEVKIVEGNLLSNNLEISNCFSLHFTSVVHK